MVASFCHADLAAQTARTIPFIESRINLDGHVDEEAWSFVEPLPVVMFEPEYRGAMTERTEIRFAHDGKYLYAAARLYDSNPDGVRANALVRDDAGGDDFFNVVIDTYTDGETAVWFLVTPRGNRMDGAITNNGEGPGWNHVEFDSFWDASAVITEEGWSAEMRIPFSSLRFNRDSSGTVQMGLIAGRYISRKSERHVYPDIRPGPAVAQYKPSLAGSVLLNEVQPQRPLYLRPYAIGGVETLLKGTGDRYDLVHEVGGDVKIGVSNDFTVDLSLNTDFAETEVDDERVNLTRYNLFFPEKRAFFLERSGTFTLDAGEAIRLFHSRVIGLDPSGGPLRVYGGARLVGRTAGWDVGVLDTYTEGADSTGDRNSGVLRLRKDVLGSESYLGGILTTSLTRGGGFDATIGADGLLRVVGDDYLTFAVGATPSAEGEELSQQSLVRALWERRDHRGWSYRGEFIRVGGAFRPALGFVERAGVTTASGAMGYGWFGGRTFQVSRVDVDGFVSRRHKDGGTEAARIEASWYAERRGGGVVEARLSWRQEGLIDPFRLGESTVPSGIHRFIEAEAIVETPSGRRLRGSLAVSGGEFFDGYRATTTLAPTWVVAPFLELNGYLEANRAWFPSRQEIYTAMVNRLRIRVSPNTRLAVHVLLQHNNAIDATATNVRLRYTVRDGDDFFLVFTSGSLGSRDPGPGERFETTRSLLLKYSTTIR